MELSEAAARPTGPAVDALYAMANLATPMAIRVFATLRIAEHLRASPATAAELSSAVAAHPEALERLLRYLARRDLLHRDETGRYALTELAAPLLDDHPGGLREWLDVDGAGRPELAFVALKHSIATGESAFTEHFGKTLWEDLAEDPARGRAFHAGLRAHARARAEVIAGSYPWHALGHVVDVGGGDGSLLVALLAAHPALRGTVFDLPGTAEEAERTLTEARVSDRGRVVAGSFFDALPAGAGGYVLSLVTHNWGDAAVTALLRRCAEAADRGARVLIIERVGDQGELHTGMDLRMLVYTGGKERSIADLSALASSAGLAHTGVYPAGEFAILELRAA